jgi:hypothetical protein
MTFYPITIASSSRVQLMRPTSLPTLASCALNPMLCHFSRESAFRRVASARTRVAACKTANLHRPFQPEVDTLQRVTPGSW